jgi:hypothetical protein
MEPAATIIAAQAVRSVKQAEGRIQMLMHHHRAANQGATPALRMISYLHRLQSGHITC